ncbi:glycosyltransferase [Geofilum rhodophaeum]|uniref:glycosyltransferase n=1 Tax=Geofilum rhodophaeum TaxID=1965019 RepID=UPI000B525F21|nr:glycosyltransferase [Geofilum rhodophaeum]
MKGVIHINLARSWRGGERQVALLMKELKRASVPQVLVCLRGSSLHKYSRDNHLPHKSFSNVGLFFFVPLLIRIWGLQKKYDVVHCHESRGHTLAFLARYLFGSKIKTVVHRRVLFPIRSKPFTLLKYSPKYVDRVVCISRAVELVVKQAVPHASTLVIPSGVPIPTEVGEKEFDLRMNFGVASDIKIVAYIAALSEEKDHRTFLKTAKIVLESRKDVCFMLIGDGILLEDLTQYTRELGIEDKVIFAGFQTMINQIIGQTDLLLFTSKSEGLGSTILDYFVHKRPVISSRNGGSEELIFEGETGFLCPVGDAQCFAKKLLNLLWDENAIQRITQNAYGFASENFSVEIIAQRTLELYENL